MEGSGQLPLVIDAAGWLSGIRWLPSPNSDDRPVGVEPELVVVHGISLPPGRFGGPWIDDLFTNRLDPRLDPYFAQIQGLRVSAHLLIRRDGTAVQYVSLLRRAWHAGVSEFQGRARCNDFAIGIELEGTDTLPYESHQYRTLARLVGVIQERWPAIDRTRIVGHCHIAPDRKTDPGPVFDWPRLWQLLDIAKPC